MAALQAKFEQFCAFGAGKDAVAEMDNAKVPARRPWDPNGRIPNVFCSFVW